MEGTNPTESRKLYKQALNILQQASQQDGFAPHQKYVQIFPLWFGRGFTFSFNTRMQVDVLRQKTMSVANHCEERIRYLEEQPATPPPSSPQKHKTAPKTPPKYSSDDAAPHDQYTDCSTPVSKEQPTTPGPFTQEKLKPLPPINSFDENDNNTVNRRRVSMSSFCKPTEASTKKQQKPVNAPTPQKSARPFKVRLYIPPPRDLALITLSLQLLGC